MTFVYDTGVLIAAERNGRAVWADHRARLELGLLPATTAPVVAQVSRSSRQVSLHRLLAGCQVIAFEPSDAREVGDLLAKSGRSDVIDAHIVTSAARLGAVVVAGDVGDLSSLAAHLGPDAAAVAVVALPG